MSLPRKLQPSIVNFQAFRVSLQRVYNKRWALNRCNFKIATCPKPQLRCGTRAPRVSWVHQSEIARQDIFENCRASAFRIAGPTDKSGPVQRKLRTRVDSKIAPSRGLQSGGRARPNEDVKLNRGGFYRMLWCLYWFLWEYNFITARARCGRYMPALWIVVYPQ